jgi:hypothetical protein
MVIPEMPGLSSRSISIRSRLQSRRNSRRRVQHPHLPGLLPGAKIGSMIERKPNRCQDQGAS